MVPEIEELCPIDILRAAGSIVVIASNPEINIAIILMHRVSQANIPVSIHLSRIKKAGVSV